MLKSMWILAVAVAIAQGPADTPRQRGDQQDHASHNATKSDSVNAPITPVAGQPGTIVQTAKGEPEKDSSKQHANYWKEAFGPANLPNWALVIVGGIAGFLAWRTVRAVQLQAAAQMDADRAWVVASVIGQPSEPLTKGLLQGIDPGIVWRIQIVGNTPAKILSERHRCIIVPGTVYPLKPQLDATPDYSLKRARVEEQLTLPPEHKYDVPIALEFPYCTMDQIVAVTQNRAVWCAFGCVEYQDAFKRKGTTQFCAFYYPQLGGVIKSPDGTVLNPAGFRMGGPPEYNFNA